MGQLLSALVETCCDGWWMPVCRWHFYKDYEASMLISASCHRGPPPGVSALELETKFVVTDSIQWCEGPDVPPPTADCGPDYSLFTDVVQRLPQPTRVTFWRH